MVFAIVAILATITFGISRGVRNAQNRAKVKVELTAIATALEQYKARYGDYPLHDSNTSDYPSSQIMPDESEGESIEVNSVMLMYALTGRMKVEAPAQAGENVIVVKVDDSLDQEEVERAPKFLDLEKFTYSVDSSGNPGAILDPWGNPYIYRYKKENTPGWDVFGYHLYSTGPNGEVANDAIKNKINETSGVLEDDFRGVADAEGIIFAGE